MGWLGWLGCLLLGRLVAAWVSQSGHDTQKPRILIPAGTLVPGTRYQVPRTKYQVPGWLADHAMCINYYFFLLTELHPTRCEQSPRSDTTPPIHMRVGTRSSNCRCKGPQGVTPGTRPRLRPPASDSVDCTLYTTPTEDFSSCTRAHADARKPCAQPRTQFGNPKHPSREPGPIPGGWAGPTSPPSDETPAGRV